MVGSILSQQGYNKDDSFDNELLGNDPPSYASGSEDRVLDEKEVLQKADSWAQVGASKGRKRSVSFELVYKETRRRRRLRGFLLWAMM